MKKIGFAKVQSSMKFPKPKKVFIIQLIVSIHPRGLARDASRSESAPPPGDLVRLRRRPRGHGARRAPRELQQGRRLFEESKL